jgi:translation initiation factor IF-2
MSDPAGKATAATDPDGETRSSQRDGGSSREGRSNVDPAGKAAAATDPTKARKGRATGRFQPGRGLRRTWQRVLTAPATGEARSGRRSMASAMTRDYTGKDADTKERGAARGGADIGKEGRCAGSRGRGCGGEQLGLPRRWRAAVLEEGEGPGGGGGGGAGAHGRGGVVGKGEGAGTRELPAAEGGGRRLGTWSRRLGRQGDWSPATRAGRSGCSSGDERGGGRRGGSAAGWRERGRGGGSSAVAEGHRRGRLHRARAPRRPRTSGWRGALKPGIGGRSNLQALAARKHSRHAEAAVMARPGSATTALDRRSAPAAGARAWRSDLAALLQWGRGPCV